MSCPSREVSRVESRADEIKHVIEVDAAIILIIQKFRDIATAENRSTRRSEKGRVPIPRQIKHLLVFRAKIDAEIVDVAAGVISIGHTDQLLVGQHSQPLVDVEQLPRLCVKR